MTVSDNSPLKGIRVLDLGTMIAGPVAATLLGEFGADVIKLEQPTGDPLRHVGPFINGEGLWWNIEGRNKKSITADLRRPEGQEIVHRLCEHVDVVVENFRPGTVAGWNIGYETLSSINPRIVMLSISGYGQTGPYAKRAAYDRIALAFAGLIHITGYPDRPPLRPGAATADYQAALYGAFSVMMALYHRDARGGVGQHIDLSLFESVFRFSDMLVPLYTNLGVVRERNGNKNFAAAPGDHFALSDGGYLVLTVSGDRMFQKLCEAIGRPELTSDPRFVSHHARWNNLDEINGIIADWILSQAPDAACAAFEVHGLAYSRVYSAKDIVEDEHYAARASIATVETPKAGPLRMPAPAPRLSNTPAVEVRAAPALGEHNEAIYKELLRFDTSHLEWLRGEQVI